MESQANYRGYKTVNIIYAPSLLYNNLSTMGDRILFCTNAEPSPLSILIDTAYPPSCTFL